MNLTIQGESSGLPKASRLLLAQKPRPFLLPLMGDGIPDEVELMVVIAVGYQSATDILHEDFQEMENAIRERKLLSDNFFAGQWGKPVSD